MTGGGVHGERMAGRGRAMRVGLAALLLLSFATACLIAAPSARATTSLTVNNVATNVITSNFLGPSVWFDGFNYMPEDTAAGVTDQDDQLDFARLAAANVHLVGTWYGEDWAMPTYGGSYDWTSTKMEAFYEWLRAAQSDGISVALNMGWWFPDDTCQSDAAPAANAGADCTPTLSGPDDTAIYAHWVSDSLNELINVMGFSNIQYIYMFREPNGAYGPAPSGYTVMTYYKHVVDAVQSQLISDGRRGIVQIVGPDIAALSADDTPSNIAAGTSWLNYAAQNMSTDGSGNSELDIYSGHDYGGSAGQPQDCSDWQSEVTTARSIIPSGKPFWMDEGNTPDPSYSLANMSSAATATAQAMMYAGDIDAGAQTAMLWAYQDTQWVAPLSSYSDGSDMTDGLMQWGLEPLPSNSAVQRPSWYVWTMMSKFLGGPGTEVYGAPAETGGICTVATKLADGGTSVMLVNTNTSAEAVTASFTTALGTMYRHQWVQGGPLPTDGQTIPTSEVIANVGTSLSETLPASSVTIFTTEDDGSRPSPTVNYTGDLSDLALTASVTASSSLTGSGWSLGGLTDGVLGPLGWASNSSTGSAHSEYFQLDLGSNKPVDSVVLYPVSGIAGDGDGFPQTLTIQLSDDGSTWTTVDSFVNYPKPTTAAAQYFTFPAQSARYIKVTGGITAPNTADGLYRFQLAEVEVALHPAAARDLALGATPIPSSTFTGSGWSTGGINDGILGPEGWASNSNTGAAHTETMALEFGAAQSFDAVTLYPADGGEGVPQSLSVDVSNDGSSWTNVLSGASTTTLAAGLPETYTFANQNSRYIRVDGDITAPNTPDNLYRFQLAELAVTQIPLASNDLAYGASITASSSLTCCGWNLTEVNDGLLGPQGWASNSSTGSPHSENLLVDMGSDTTIDNVTLAPATYPTDSSVQGFPQGLTIQVSTDGSTWTTEYSSSSYPAPSSAVLQSFGFAPISARYVKVTGAISAPNTQDNLYRFMLGELLISDN
jgi:hypothetical protein